VVNLALHPPNPDLWREGADHFEKTRTYYGDNYGLDDQGEGAWGPWPTDHTRIPSPLLPRNKDITTEQPVFSSSESDIPNAVNLDEIEILVFNNDDNDNPFWENGSGNGDAHNNERGRNVGNTATPNFEGSLYDCEGNGRPEKVSASICSSTLLRG
jgi:hypothetical protein